MTVLFHNLIFTRLMTDESKAQSLDEERPGTVRSVDKDTIRVELHQRDRYVEI